MKRNFNFPRLDPDLLLDEDTRQDFLSNFNELASGALPHWDPHITLEFFKMSMRTAANNSTCKRNSEIQLEENQINANLNELINEAAKLDDREPRKLVINEAIDIQHWLKRNIVQKIDQHLESKNTKRWYNEGELSNKYFFKLLNKKIA